MHSAHKKCLKECNKKVVKLFHALELSAISKKAKRFKNPFSPNQMLHFNNNNLALGLNEYKSL